jgi:23S rRNA pseudouridine2605 synthase
MQLPIRADRYLRENTRNSLAEVRAAFATERVEIRSDEGADGGRPANPSDLVFVGDTVEWNGVAIERATQVRHYLALNKPKGVTTTARDPDGHADLSSFLGRMPNGVFPVGRLDRNTSGLLLFTNDGDLSHALLHPTHHVEKRYWLWLDECLTSEDQRLVRLVDGLDIAGSPTQLRAAKVCVTHCSPYHTELLLWLREGKRRQIRKMCQALRFRLAELHRQAIGKVFVDGLASGEIRGLTQEEVESLWAAAGGRELVIERQVHALACRAQAARACHQPLLRLERWLALLETRGTISAGSADAGSAC